MFKTTASKAAKGEVTRKRILQSALKLFRRRGFERTTMRDIARAADLSLGAAYHYFPTKEALVHSYYEWMQAEHERLVENAAPQQRDLRARVAMLLGTKVDLLRRDRRLLAALFNHLGDASHPLSLFGKKTAALRDRSLAQFEAVFEDPGVPEELRAFLGRALWFAHLALFLFFIHDSSPRQAKTHKVLDALVDLVASAVPLVAHPLAVPLRRKLLDLMAELAS